MPIRVLQIVTIMNMGGLETMLMNYYRHIDRSKVQFDFLVHRQERGVYEDEIESLGGHIFRMPRLNPFSLSYYKKLRNFFKEHPYKIVHCHLDCMSAVPLRVAKNCGINVRIAHCHSANQDKDWKYPIKILFRHRISHEATELFACSKAAGDWTFCGAEYKVIPNAIDVNHFKFNQEVRNQMRKKLGVGDAVVIGHVGRFSPVKNHSFLIDVFYEYLKINTNAYLLLVGDGETRADIENKVAKMGIEDRVIFAGLQKDTAPFYQAMDVFVLPSLYEGFGMVALEAITSGLSVLVSQFVPDEIKKMDNCGFYTLERGPQFWAMNISQRTNIANRISTHDYSMFAIDSCAYELEEYYLAKNDVQK